MAKLLTRQELEEMHDMLRGNFREASSGIASWEVCATAKATAALALLEADSRLRELADEDTGKIARLPAPLPGKAS